MTFRYESGEEIMQGDQILYGGQPGVVEFIADPDLNPTDWYVSEHGGGVMLTAFGGVFLNEPEKEEDLLLVARSHDVRG
jgi:hypothetical protein